MNSVIIQKGFWRDRLEVNARAAIFHQWEQLDWSGCFENFRIAAGLSDGLRTGWFFSDSDAYKWLEAAARIQANDPSPRLAALIDDFIELLARTQALDGYLFTYNQIHFPNVRWQNLQIEHELYCHGHLIEAGVSHYETSGRSDLLAIAVRAADRIVTDFSGKGPSYTPGHEEIEIALLRLHQVMPGDGAYLRLALQFIEQRGRTPLFGFQLFRQERQVNQRGKLVQQKREEYLAAHPDYDPYQLPPGNIAKKQRSATMRWYLSALSGKYFQQHAPIRKQTIPVGHAVRFAYLETAAAMLARLSGDRSLLPALERAWERMLTRRMYVTGGIGSQPGLEGFGNDYELDPEYAYAETCAALGSLFWNWEMAGLTDQAKYSDLFEWQLYNAAAPGMGLEGVSYLYNNPLACQGGVERRPWYKVPCCPSNLSRTWADLGKYIYSIGPGVLRLHQYISSRLVDGSVQTDASETTRVSLEMETGLPWQGYVRIKLNNVIYPDPARQAPFELQLRQPSWAGGMRVAINGTEVISAAAIPPPPDATASGYDPRLAEFHRITRVWQSGDEILIDLEMPIVLRQAHPKMRGHRGKATVTRGPLVYCLESPDQPDIDLFSARLDPDSLKTMLDETLLGGIVKITGRSLEGHPLTFIPYFLWGNRGPCRMTVWVNVLRGADTE